MTAPKRQLALSLPLILLPTLARADSLDGLVWLVSIVVGLYGVAILTILVTSLAYRLTKQVWLRWLSWMLLGASLLLGLLWQQAFGAVSAALSGLLFNPFLFVCLPLGMWLHGAWYVRQATDNWPRMVGLAVAVLGLSTLLGQALSWLATSLWWAGEAGSGAAYVALPGTLGVGCVGLAWWLVLRQARPYAPLPVADWVQISATAGVYAGLALAFAGCSTWMMLSTYNNRGGLEAQLTTQVLQLLTGAATSFVVAGLMLWLEQRRHPAPTPTL